MKCIILSISAALLLTGTKIVAATDNVYLDFDIITGDDDSEKNIYQYKTDNHTTPH